MVQMRSPWLKSDYVQVLSTVKRLIGAYCAVTKTFRFLKKKLQSEDTDSRKPTKKFQFQKIMKTFSFT